MADDEVKPIVRIADVDLDGHKKVPYALTGIKGIGIRMAYAICRELGLDEEKKLGELSDEEIERSRRRSRSYRKESPTSPPGCTTARRTTKRAKICTWSARNSR